MCREICLLIAVWDDAENMFLCLSGDIMDDFFKFIAIAVLLGFQGASAGSFQVTEDLKTGLIAAVATGKGLATVVSVIYCFAECEKRPEVLNLLHVMEFPVDVYMFICFVATDNRVALWAAIPFGLILVALFFACLYSGRKLHVNVQAEIYKRGFINAALILCSVFISGVVNSNGAWEKLSLQEKLPWFRAMFGIGFIFMLYFTGCRIKKNSEIAGASSDKKKSRHIAHTCYFVVEEIFYFLAFIYVCSGAGIICLICLLLLLGMLAVRYISFQFFFDGHFKFLTSFRKIQFMMNKDRTHRKECYDPHPFVFGDEDNDLVYKPPVDPQNPNLPTEGQQLSSNRYSSN